jgi:hypothetical protein
MLYPFKISSKMTTAKFDFHKWLNWGKQKRNSYHTPNALPDGIAAGSRDRDVESLIIQIEAYRIDLTCNYHDWMIIGFALADEYGIEGSSRFHRISRFHLAYDPDECEAQYTKCMRGRSGITIRTLFWMAAQAGITPGA